MTQRLVRRVRSGEGVARYITVPIDWPVDAEVDVVRRDTPGERLRSELARAGYLDIRGDIDRLAVALTAAGYVRVPEDPEHEHERGTWHTHAFGTNVAYEPPGSGYSLYLTESHLRKAGFGSDHAEAAMRDLRDLIEKAAEP